MRDPQDLAEWYKEHTYIITKNTPIIKEKIPLGILYEDNEKSEYTDELEKMRKAYRHDNN